jgi:hypothetical protein
MGGWMDGWVGGWMDGCKSRFKDCLQQSKIQKFVAQLKKSVFMQLFKQVWSSRNLRFDLLNLNTKI